MRSSPANNEMTSAVNRTGSLIVNADDWGRDRETTDRTLDCIRCGAVSSVSAMVFMQDSERAASIARDQEVDAGLHLNFTSPFSQPGVPPELAVHQERVANYLLRHRFSQTVFHPGLSRSFAYVVAAQLNEFARLYGHAPTRLDGHHHMHLCANVLFGGLLPQGTIVRRNFSFQPGEKSIGNRGYRQFIDWILSRRHRLTDMFFSIQPLTPNHLQQILDLSCGYVVEMETHPKDPAEYRSLTSDRILSLIRKCTSASFRESLAIRPLP